MRALGTKILQKTSRKVEGCGRHGSQMRRCGTKSDNRSFVLDDRPHKLLGGMQSFGVGSPSLERVVWTLPAEKILVWLARTFAKGVMDCWEAVEEGAVAMGSLCNDAAVPMSSLAVRIAFSVRSLAAVPLVNIVGVSRTSSLLLAVLAILF